MFGTDNTTNLDAELKAARNIPKKSRKRPRTRALETAPDNATTPGVEATPYVAGALTTDGQHGPIVATPIPAGAQVPTVAMSAGPVRARPSASELVGDPLLSDFPPNLSSPVVAHDSDVDDHTTLASDLVHTQGAGLGVSAEIVLEDGRVIPVNGDGLILGRAPRPNGSMRSVVITEPTKQISKTHVKLITGPQGVTIIDLGSANGTTVIWRGHRIVCTAHLGVTIPDTGAINLADVATIHIKIIDSGQAWGNC